MAFITLSEIFGMIAVSFIIGYILSGYIRKPRSSLDLYYGKLKSFEWEDLKFSTMIAAPAVILHELGHKFVGLGFGLPAVFQAYWGGLGFGVILKLIGSPFIILAPAYVSIPSIATPIQMGFIALAGPLVNLCLWLASDMYLRYHKKPLKKNTIIALTISKKLNLFLFIFNMIPFPPLDGYKILTGFGSLL